MKSCPFLISYTDPKDGDLLPINNDDNFARALHTAAPLLRVFLQRKGLFLAVLSTFNAVLVLIVRISSINILYRLYVIERFVFIECLH